MMPATAPKCCTANASTGVGSSRGITRVSKPAAAKTAAESVANSAERNRPSYPMTTTPPPRPALASQVAIPAARPTHDRGVHPVRSRAQWTAQSRGPERQRSAEPIGELIPTPHRRPMPAARPRRRDGLSSAIHAETSAASSVSWLAMRGARSQPADDFERAARPFARLRPFRPRAPPRGRGGPRARRPG